VTYEKFTEDYLSKGLIKKQKSNHQTIEKLILRAGKDLKTSKANLSIDEGIAYTIAYLAMLHAGSSILEKSELVTICDRYRNNGDGFKITLDRML